VVWNWRINGSFVIRRVVDSCSGADNRSRVCGYIGTELMALEAANIEDLLLTLPQGKFAAAAIPAARAWAEFVRFTGLETAWPLEMAAKLARSASDITNEADYIQSPVDIAFARSEDVTACTRYEEAVPLYCMVGDVLGEGNCHLFLARTIAMQRDPA
jgi:hypothetical protein